MPCKRNPTFKRRRTFRKRTPAKAAYTALKIVKQLKKQVEVKKIDILTYSLGVPLNADGIVTPLTQITQGNNFANRIGNEVVIKNININGLIRIHPSSSVPSCVRIVLFYDRQEQAGTLPLMTDMYDPTALSTDLAPFAKLKRETVGRFQILKTYRTIVDITTPWKQFKLNLSFKKPYKVMFSGVSSITNRRGTIYMATFASDLIGAPYRPVMSCEIRTSFIDD